MDNGTTFKGPLNIKIINIIAKYSADRERAQELRMVATPEGLVCKFLSFLDLLFRFAPGLRYN